MKSEKPRERMKTGSQTEIKEDNMAKSMRLPGYKIMYK